MIKVCEVKTDKIKGRNNSIIIIGDINTHLTNGSKK